MKQFNLFSKEVNNIDEEKKYSSKVEAPIYKPRGIKPHILELYDNEKTKKLIKEIEKSNIPTDEKMFLIDAARRHTIFNYEKIADYYANSNKEMQELMEKSALVIIDFEKAIQNGFVKLCDDIKKQYLEEYGE